MSRFYDDLETRSADARAVSPRTVDELHRRDTASKRGESA